MNTFYVSDTEAVILIDVFDEHYAIYEVQSLKFFNWRLESRRLLNFWNKNWFLKCIAVNLAIDELSKDYKSKFCIQLNPISRGALLEGSFEKTLALSSSMSRYCIRASFFTCQARGPKDKTRGFLLARSYTLSRLAVLLTKSAASCKIYGPSRVIRRTVHNGQQFH